MRESWEPELVPCEEMTTSGPGMLVGFKPSKLTVRKRGQHAGLLSLGLVGLRMFVGLCGPLSNYYWVESAIFLGLI